jgi:hypothetical protein
MSCELMHSIQNEFLANLPPFMPIKKMAGVDRYGFSSLLARRCGRRNVPRSFANWIHGWVWSEEPTPELLASANLPRDLTIIVCKATEQLALKSAGFTDIRLGGLPFAYVQPQHTARQATSLLAFPPHSSEAGRVTLDQGAYFDYLESIKHDFESLYVSLHYLDMNGPLQKAALARGLKVVQGARPDDANSLLRTRSTLDSFTYVTSNVMGSHMLYALFAGCKFSFCGPIYTYDESIFRIAGYQSIDQLVKLFSDSYLRGKFNKFFVNHPRLGVADKYFAADSIGERFIMHPQDIEDALGWTFAGQIKGYAAGASRRLIRTITA